MRTSATARPPESSVPGLLALIEGVHPSGRYRARELASRLRPPRRGHDRRRPPAGGRGGARAFDLVPAPAALEAREPPEIRGRGRDDVRLMVASRSEGHIEHARFAELPDHLRAGDLLVVNVSSTLPAAITAVRADGSEVRLHVSTPATRTRLALAYRRAAKRGWIAPGTGRDRAAVDACGRRWKPGAGRTVRREHAAVAHRATTASAVLMSTCGEAASRSRTVISVATGRWPATRTCTQAFPEAPRWPQRRAALHRRADHPARLPAACRSRRSCCTAACPHWSAMSRRSPSSTRYRTRPPGWSRRHGLGTVV